MSGWSDLGGILSGSVARGAEADYSTQLRKNYLAYSALEEAKRERSINMARDSLSSTFERMGYKEGLVNMVLANNSPSMSQLGDAQNPNFYRGQEAAWQSSGLDGGVQDLGRVATAQSLASGTPLKRVDIQGGYQLDPYAPNTPIKLTELGQADLGATNARATSSLASANNSDASAAQTLWETEQRSQGKPDSFNTPPKSTDLNEIQKVTQMTRDKLKEINNLTLNTTDLNPKTGKPFTEVDLEAEKKKRREVVRKTLIDNGYKEVANKIFGSG